MLDITAHPLPSAGTLDDQRSTGGTNFHPEHDNGLILEWYRWWLWLLFFLGIGKETAKELAKRGAKVIMACRNLTEANKVKGKLIFSLI